MRAAGPRRGVVHQGANPEVGEQKAPRFLPHELRRLAAEHPLRSRRCVLNSRTPSPSPSTPGSASPVPWRGHAPVPGRSSRGDTRSSASAHRGGSTQSPERESACGPHSGRRSSSAVNFDTIAVRRQGLLQGGRPGAVGGQRRHLPRKQEREAQREVGPDQRGRSRVRARVEHPFHVVKRLWGFAKVRYRGQMKNRTRAFAASALANLYQLRYRLAAQGT